MNEINPVGEEMPLVDWIALHGKKIVWGFTALLLLLFLLFRLYSGSSAKAEKDFIEAANLAPQLFEPAKAAEATEKLQVLVQKHPSLEAEYDGLMAQSLLNQNGAKKAAPLFERTLSRIHSEDLKPFLQNSEIALALSEGKLEETYSAVVSLKETLSQDKNVLYYFNLLRLGMLEQALGKKEEEKKTWDEFMQSAKEASESFQAFLRAIDTPGVSIVTFIEAERQKSK